MKDAFFYNLRKHPETYMKRRNRLRKTKMLYIIIHTCDIQLQRVVGPSERESIIGNVQGISEKLGNILTRGCLDENNTKMLYKIIFKSLS